MVVEESESGMTRSLRYGRALCFSCICFKRVMDMSERGVGGVDEIRSLFLAFRASVTQAT